MQCFISSCTTAAFSTPEKRPYCARHYLEHIEKRVRKDIRIRKILSTKKTYYLLASTTKEYALAQYFLDRIFNKHLKLIPVKAIPTKIAARSATIVPTNLDREVNRNLKYFLEKKPFPKDQHILFLDHVLDDEMLIVCRILKIHHSTREQRNPLFAALEEKHPGTTFALKKSLDHCRRTYGRT
jgi:hypothetical protein